MPTTQTSKVSSWWRGAPKKEGERYHRQQAGDGGGDGLTAVCLLLSQEQCPKAPSISEARAPRSARRTARSVASRDVPRPVRDLFEFQSLHSFYRRGRGRKIHLVRKEQDRDFLLGHPRVREHRLELILDDREAQLVRGINDDDDALDITIIVLPEVAITALS